MFDLVYVAYTEKLTMIAVHPIYLRHIRGWSLRRLGMVEQFAPEGGTQLGSECLRNKRWLPLLRRSLRCMPQKENTHAIHPQRSHGFCALGMNQSKCLLPLFLDLQVLGVSSMHGFCLRLRCDDA